MRNVNDAKIYMYITMRMYNCELVVYLCMHDSNICSGIREDNIIQVSLSHHMTLHCHTDKSYNYAKFQYKLVTIVRFTSKLVFMDSH